MQLALTGTGQRQHCSDVLTLALQGRAVLLLVGIIPGVTAGYMTRMVNVIIMLMTHTLKSSDNVIVRDVITCFTELFIRVAL